MQGELVTSVVALVVALLVALSGMWMNWQMFLKLRNERRDYLKETLSLSDKPAANHLAHEMEKTDRMHDLATAGADMGAQAQARRIAT